MQTSSADLWRRWRSDGDDAAFAALVLPELPRAVAVARGTGCDAGAAEDAVQDALVALARERSDAPVTLGPRVWLLRCVRDRARSSLRAMRRRRSREQTVARNEAAPSRAPACETTEVVERALAQLGDDEREAVRLRYALDLEYGEVARVLGTNEGAARVRVHRAMERLRARLGADAATMLAALPLPVLARPEGLVSAALGKAAAAAAGGATGLLAGTGGAVMATAKTMAGFGAAALIGGVIATTLVAPALRDAAPTDAARATTAVASETSPPDKPAARKRTGHAAGDVENVRQAPWLDDLGPTDEERAWLRTALVEERERREKSAIRAEDTGADVLSRYLHVRADVEPVLATFEAARAHVLSPKAEPMRFPAPDAKGGADLSGAAGASIIEFGPGRFDLRGARGAFFDRQGSVDALEIRGAGKNETTLVVGRDQEFRFGSDAKNVVFRDMTIDDPTADATPFNVRGTASFAFENVRVVGWSSAGHGAALGVGGQAFVACRDCDFQNSGSFALSVRGPCLAVFERCNFTDTYSAFIATGAASGGRPSVVRVIDCTFLGTRLADSRSRPGVTDELDLRVRGGHVTFGSADMDDAARRKSWGAEFAASVEGVAFAPDPPRLTCGDLVRVLELATAQGWDPVVRADYVPVPRNAPPRIDLYVAAQNAVDRHLVDFVDGALREVADVKTARAGILVRSRVNVVGVLPLRTVLGRQTDIATAAVTLISLEPPNANGSDGWTVWLYFGTSGRRGFDAATGEVRFPK